MFCYLLFIFIVFFLISRLVYSSWLFDDRNSSTWMWSTCFSNRSRRNLGLFL